MSGALERTSLPAPALPPGRPRLVLVGFMGTGKTEVGRLVAARLDRPFVDLDDAVRRRAGASVSDIFSAGGEEAFRRIERAVLGDAARLSGAVVATGGGAVVHGAAFASLAAGSEVVLLTADPAELERRLAAGPDRPLQRPDPPGRIRALLAERAEAYRAAGSPLDTTGRTPQDVAAELAGRLRSGSGVRVEVPGPDGAYPFMIAPHGALGEAVAAALPGATRAAVVVDDAVDAGTAVAALQRAGLDTGEPLRLPRGEAAKDSATVAGLWDAFHRRGLDRGDPVVAVGGGACLDAAGFAAATYARGLPLVNVPTTILAMVDASLGGKVGVDHAGVKNLVGGFHHPRLVLADPAALATLPHRALRAGLAEAVKAAVVGSSLALDVLETLPLDGRGLPHPLDWVIEQAVRVKAAFVGADPLDRSLRHALNLGHTFAHAVESASGHAVLHGEAVAMGTVAAARLGAEAGLTDPALAERLAALLSRFGLPTAPPPGLDPAALAAAMASDKKRRSGRLVLVIPGPDGAELVTGLDADDAVRALLAPAGAWS